MGLGRIHEPGNQRVEIEVVLLFITPRDLLGELVLPIPTCSQMGTSTRRHSHSPTQLKIKGAA